jgi:hypothetical protein
MPLMIDRFCSGGGAAPGLLHQSAANPSKHAIPLRSDHPGSSLPPKGSLE